MSYLRFYGSSLMALLMGTAAIVHPAQAQTVGTVGSANGGPTAVSPGGGTRTIAVGDTVSANERVVTGPNGTAQVMFSDRSALNVGRSSDVKVESYSYDPPSGTGEQTLAMARGVARFVGGQVSHTSGTTAKTPVATIGVRGGTVTFAHRGQTTTVMVHSGSATVSSAGGSVVLRAGQQTTVAGGAAPSGSGPIDVVQLRTFTSQLASQGSQTGGAVQQPTDGQASRNQVGTARPSTVTPNFDLPAAGDDLAKSKAQTVNQPY